MAERQRIIDTQVQRIIELDSVLAAASAADNTGNEELKQINATNRLRITALEESSVDMTTKHDHRIAEFLRSEEVYQNDAKNAEFKESSSSRTLSRPSTTSTSSLLIS
eukprot:14014686-Heterocapsa_arctica.AAC.1